MPLLTLLGQISSTHTVGGTSQLSGFSSTGGLNVFTIHTVGGAGQLGAFGSAGGTLVVSATTDTPSGGFWFGYDQYHDKHRRDRKERKAKDRQIKDDLERLIALEERRLEEESARRLDLEALTDFVIQYKGSLKKETSERIEFVARQAINKRTFSAMERLERELSLLREEEEFLIMATMMIINEQTL